MATDSIIPVYPVPRTEGQSLYPYTRCPAPKGNPYTRIPGAPHRRAIPSRTLPRNGSRGALQPAPMPPLMTWPPERRCGRRLP